MNQFNLPQEYTDFGYYISEKLIDTSKSLYIPDDSSSGIYRNGEQVKISFKILFKKEIKVLIYVAFLSLYRNRHSFFSSQMQLWSEFRILGENSTHKSRLESDYTFFRRDAPIKIALSLKFHESLLLISPRFASSTMLELSTLAARLSSGSRTSGF